MRLVLALTLTLVSAFGLLAGITVRDFRNISSIQEMECSGDTLRPEISLLSLKTFRVADGTVTAYLNTLKHECITLTEYSSCVIDSGNTRRSRLRFLVHDLQEGESREYGCTANSFRSLEDTRTWTWTVTVRRNSEYDAAVVDVWQLSVSTGNDAAL